MITVPVRQITHATPRTRLLSLDLRAVQFPFAAGQAVMLGLSGSPLRKPYSIASAPWEVTKSGIMQVLVQVEDSGGLDPHLELASPGTPLDLDGPFGSFGLPDRVETPAALRRRRHRHRAASLDVDRAPVAADETSGVVDLQRAIGGRVCVSAGARRARDGGKNHVVFHGHARGKAGVAGTKRPHQRSAAAEKRCRRPTATCLVCGPPSLVNDTRSLLTKLGVSSERILTEKF